jgi:GntR family transcriptional regulator
MPGSLPLHAQLKEAIISAIAEGKYKADEQLPSQRELCEIYQMSHMTIRRAINELVNEGVIYSVPGKGLFVAKPSKTMDFSTLHGLNEQISRFGMSASTRVLEARLIHASTVLAQTLQVPVGTTLVYLHRLRFADGAPLAITTAYLPHHLCPNLLETEDATEALLHTLRTVYGLHLAGSRTTVSAELADSTTAELLELASPTAVLIREQITFLDTGEPIEFSRTLSRGDIYHVQYIEGQVPDEPTR